MRTLLSIAPVSVPGRRRIIPVAVVLILTALYIHSWVFVRLLYPGPTKLPTQITPDAHPITQLISNATAHFESLLRERSFTLKDAAEKYRQRRGRHPPPGFDAWFKQAMKDDAIVVESFFDRIHHDINPLWALEPREMRMQAALQPQVIKIRNKKVVMVTDDPDRQPWIQHWTALVKQMMPNLPDLDMAINVMDESRILTPREMIDKYVKIEQERRELLAPELAMTKYSSRQDIDNQKPETFDPGWISDDANLYWNYFRETCPTDSPSRNISALESFNVPVEYPSEQMPHAYRGFVQNFTQARDPCLQPHLRGLQGTFVESVSMSTTTTLFPLFAGSKLPTNNELLIPAAMYLSRRAFYSGGRGSGGKWSTKRNALLWRGTALGGRNKADNWWHFHRHRWVQMMNGTAVARVEAGDAASAPTLNLLSAANYSLPRAMGGQIGAWLSNFSDVSGRARTRPHMGIAASKPLQQQYRYKYLPDVDGHSFSGRWRAFLKSTSVPLKATIYAEWHDDRMVPWVHFVPFDASYKDIYAVMEYFLDGRDAQAEVIATESSNWANAVYRDEDMKLYVWRLLLEYARVVDDNRQRLAFVDDLRKEKWPS
ncbi:hypothetical protein LMH87_004865 [Akanthomyces muscarius]|uniref:Glycosyl transferase CAP10 domain-containing protein n=1 Tax=Akanthomyces muscarius TaxID=2231603 RepID=A0A9W8Q5G3_AKAMU|nr:hypothetical protein LMH87_004865 [Akanthomyces muscarius]KAJ4146035.1 hypothetical protein LMH87_004865 [Akanthomyces muscarius]